MRALLSRFRKASSGLAAVEFALILPVMITLFFGVVEVSLVLSCRADVVNLASTTADLVAQESTIAPEDMTNIFNAATAILYPYDPSKATITVFSIIDNGTSTGQIAWSCTKTGTAAAVTGTAPLPAGSAGGDMIAATNLDPQTHEASYGGSGSVILVKIDYSYASPATKVVVGDITMSNTFYTKPRRVARIPKPTSCS